MFKNVFIKKNVYYFVAEEEIGEEHVDAKHGLWGRGIGENELWVWRNMDGIK